MSLSDQIDSVMESIASLLSRYESLISPGSFGFNVNDVILITYADSFKIGDENGLQTLNKVL